jgi:hypothetical protein
MFHRDGLRLSGPTWGDVVVVMDGTRTVDEHTVERARSIDTNRLIYDVHRARWDASNRGRSPHDRGLRT